MFHAKEVLESWNGGISILSSTPLGTTLRIKLLKSLAPIFHIDHINLLDFDEVCIIDDEISVHQLLTNRFKGKTVYSFTNPEEFLARVEYFKTKKILFLVDFEFSNFKLNGLDIILNNKLESKSVLITSHYDEENIQKVCSSRDIKLLDKSMLTIIPIIEESSGKKKVYLVDDDRLVHMVWGSAAVKKDIELISFYSRQELMAKLSQIDNDAEIYIDKMLGDEDGEQLALELAELGFSNLSMVTGLEAQQLSHLTFLKGVFDKSPRV